MRYYTRLTIVILFSIAMAYCESAVVVYLRGWLLPDGGQWNLSSFPLRIIFTEMGREAGTMVMLVAIGFVAGRSRWDRVGYFLISFGTWDLFYYIWLKVLIGWPESLFTPDVLFLIPKPWVGYVIEPCAVSLLMVIFGIAVTQRIDSGRVFVSAKLSWALIVIGSISLLAGFISYRTVNGIPISEAGPWRSLLIGIALVSYVVAFFLSLRKSNAAVNRH